MVDITIDSLTNGSVKTTIPDPDIEGEVLNVTPHWSGTGVFDELVSAVNKNIELQYDANRIDGTTFAEVYLGSMQAVLAQSVQFVLQEKQIEADIAIKKEELELKKIQKVLTERQISQIENDIELANNNDTRQQTQLDDQLLTAVKQRSQLDSQIAQTERQTAQIEDNIKLANNNDTRQELQLQDQLITSKTQRVGLERDISLKEKQTELTGKDIELKDDSLLTTAKQRSQLDSQITQTERQIAQIEKQTANMETEDLLKLAQIGKTKIEADSTLAITQKDVDLKEGQLEMTESQRLEVVDGTIRANIQLDDQLLTAAKQREQTDKQIDQIDNSIDVSSRDIAEKEATGVKQRAVMDKDIDLKEKQLEMTESQRLEVVDGTVRANTQLDDQLLTSAKQRVVTDKDVLIKGQQYSTEQQNTKVVQWSASKVQYEAETLLVDQHLLSTKDLDLKDDQLLTTVKQRNQIDSSITQTERQTTQIENAIELANNEDTRKQTQLDDTLLTGKVHRAGLERDVSIKEKQIELTNKDIELKDDSLLTTAKQREQIDSSIAQTERQTTQIEKQTTNMETEDLLRLTQIGKTKIEADSTLAMTQKDIDLKEGQLELNIKQIEKLGVETAILEQKIVGRKKIIPTIGN